MRTSRSLSASLLALTVALAGCASTSSSAGGTTPSAAEAEADVFTVVATHSIIGDLVSNVAGDAVAVEIVMPAGADPHEFEPSAQQIELMGAADLLVANGMGFEEQLIEAIEVAGADGVTVLSLGEDLDPIPFAGGHDEHAEEEGSEHADEEGSEHAEEEGSEHADEEGSEHEEEEGSEHADEEGSEHAEEEGSDDPHWFQDPDRAAEAARLIGAALAEGSDARTPEEWTAAADEYATSLEELAAGMEETLADLPDANRKLVTNHDAFGYFADRFDFEVVGTVIPSGTTLAEPSAADLEELAETIEREGVPAIFAENTQPEELADALIGEVDVEVEVVELFSDSLGDEGSDGATYSAMMETNAGRVAEALAT